MGTFADGLYDFVLFQMDVHLGVASCGFFDLFEAGLVVDVTLILHHLLKHPSLIIILMRTRPHPVHQFNR
jgi:hypothetical protein